MKLFIMHILVIDIIIKELEDMKRVIVCVMIITVFISFNMEKKEVSANSVYIQKTSMEYEDNMKRDLLCIMMAYPEYVASVEKNTNGSVYAVMKSGAKLLYDDKQNKSYDEKLNNPDIQDMMEQLYPLNDIEDLLEKNYDPGRIRVYPLLKLAYGGSEKQVQSNLIKVKMGHTNCQFNKSNKAAEALKSVMGELIPMANSRRDIYSCVFPQSGTFNYRIIAGTNRLSPHSFGIAIDLASNKWDYWKWTGRTNGEKRLDAYPREIVKIFEKNNFIWGGKWGHFDILHFEYRPEIIMKSRYFANPDNSNGLWYSGVPEDDEKVIEYINIIEKALK
ncbi:MAG: family metallopeptidase [Clostridiales bacterium]|jgi:hypothetical protein|nr:family metallopeptidase [Clostridiales bacterium]